ncbi:MAG: phosphoribosylamine--glycine ligase [Fuerstiella sp.]|nr:phosphoribosylamine--glycine ligase [Fuerstiella sp.]MCP4853957.1 phosphoribosylamine--glycine ligase [Fuerstiella sp.]
MKVLVVGQGGREHTLVWKLAQSPVVEKVYCAPGNAGTAVDGENVNIAADDLGRLMSFAKHNDIGLTVVGPEVPLVAGIVDEFKSHGLKVFGPSKAAARLEGSKAFSKEIMKKAGVPTAASKSFTRLEEAHAYLDALDDVPIVVKADGLAAGKGVHVCKNCTEGKAAATQMLQDGLFGPAGQTIVIEECLEGQEASILAIVDGDTIIPLETSQDHKRAHDGDLGPNTGGMGAYSPAPLVTDDIMDDIIRRILVPTIHTMRVEGHPFSGVLYAGLMLTQHGPKVIEYNVRFGDPEAQAVLMRLKTDLTQILSLAASGRLAELEGLEWDERPAVCVVMASEGYPGSYPKGRAISGINEADQLSDTKVFHAGTMAKDMDVLTDGGRVLGVTAMGDSIADAKQAAYQAVERICWDGAWNRSDISDKA